MKTTAGIASKKTKPVASKPAPTPLFDQLAACVRRRFENLTNSGARLFTTDVDTDALWLAYLAGFEPLKAEAQGHNCHACRTFIQRFGGLAIISDAGEVLPTMWDSLPVPLLYNGSVDAMFKMVARSKITGVFLTNAEHLGQEVTGEWHHFAVKTPRQAREWGNAMLLPHQAMAEKSENYRNVVAALREFKLPVVATAHTVLTSNALYRSEKLLGQAQWLLELATLHATMNGRTRDNLTWLKIASAPAGFCHPRSSMIGTLLEDLVAGMDFATVSRRFAEKMDPLKYQRPTAAPSAGNIEQAEKLVEKMGIADSLRRRFARVDEVLQHAIWLPSRPNPTVVDSVSKGVFSHLMAKPAEVKIILPTQTMTWVKFLATVLPNAAKLEFVVTGVPNNYTALVTAADPNAPPILQWDPSPDGVRNPVSWYLYSGGSSPQDWNLVEKFQPMTPREVLGIVPQPSMWSAAGSARNPHAHHGEAVAVLLKDMFDTRYKGAGNALFPETLKTEMHAISSTIEAYSRTSVIEDGMVPCACGLRLQNGANFGGAEFVVTGKDGTTSNYRLDRWD